MVYVQTSKGPQSIGASPGLLVPWPREGPGESPQTLQNLFQFCKRFGHPKRFLKWSQNKLQKNKRLINDWIPCFLGFGVFQVPLGSLPGPSCALLDGLGLQTPEKQSVFRFLQMQVFGALKLSLALLATSWPLVGRSGLKTDPQNVFESCPKYVRKLSKKRNPKNDPKQNTTMARLQPLKPLQNYPKMAPGLPKTNHRPKERPTQVQDNPRQPKTGPRQCQGNPKQDRSKLLQLLLLLRAQENQESCTTRCCESVPRELKMGQARPR